MPLLRLKVSRVASLRRQAGELGRVAPSKRCLTQTVNSVHTQWVSVNVVHEGESMSRDADPVDAPLVGIYEIAQLAGVSRTVISNWRVRDGRFPPPIADLRSGPVFREDQVRRYLRRRKKQMAHIISTINLKGGVGKTTTTVALAEFRFQRLPSIVGHPKIPMRSYHSAHGLPVRRGCPWVHQSPIFICRNGLDPCACVPSVL